jgi:hypothetical protein
MPAVCSGNRVAPRPGLLKSLHVGLSCIFMALACPTCNEEATVAHLRNSPYCAQRIQSLAAVYRRSKRTHYSGRPGPGRPRDFVWLAGQHCPREGCKSTLTDLVATHRDPDNPGATLEFWKCYRCKRPFTGKRDRSGFSYGHVFYVSGYGSAQQNLDGQSGTSAPDDSARDSICTGPGEATHDQAASIASD